MNTLMLDHDRGPGHALIECSASGCTARHLIEDISWVPDQVVISRITEAGWSTKPDLCPEHGGVIADRAYLLIDREMSEDLAVLYPSIEKAEDALANSDLIDSLCEEDCLDAWVHQDTDPLSNMLCRELIIP